MLEVCISPDETEFSVVFSFEWSVTVVYIGFGTHSGIYKEVRINFHNVSIIFVFFEKSDILKYISTFRLFVDLTLILVPQRVIIIDVIDVAPYSAYKYLKYFNETRN